jgi:hypothetical protein
LISATLEVVAAVGAAVGVVLLWLRRRVVGKAPHILLVIVCLATVAALIVGTAVQVSGVVLTIPVLAGMIWVVWRSPWRAGDVALLILVSAIGGALGYVVAAALDPDTGSYGDQSAMGLATLAVPLLVVAAFSARRRIRAQAPR